MPNPQSFERRFLKDADPPVDEFGGTGAVDSKPLGAYYGDSLTVQIGEKTGGTLTSTTKVMVKTTKDMPWIQVGADVSGPGLVSLTDYKVHAVMLKITAHTAGTLIASLSGWNWERGD